MKKTWYLWILCLLDHWLLRRMYSNRRFLVWPAQDHLLLPRERQHPLARIGRQRLRPRNHRHHVRLLHLEGEDRLSPRMNADRLLRPSDVWPLLFSSTSPKRTGATRARASVCLAGLWEITTTTPPLTCGCTARTAATCIMEASWCARCPHLLKVTPSPASWTWRLTPCHLPRTTRFGCQYNKSIFFLLLFDFFFCFCWWCVSPFLCTRSLNWPLKVWWPQSFTHASCSTAATLERRCSICSTQFINVNLILLSEANSNQKHTFILK